MKKLLLSAAILTAFVANAKAMEGKDECPDAESLRWAVGALKGDKVGQSFDFTDEKGRTWHGENVQNPHNKKLENLVTGANPFFTHTAPGMCHVSFNKEVNRGETTEVVQILELDLTREE